VNTDVLVLGLASVVRPTSLAAVFALLGTAEPRRLLTAYLVVGLGFTLAVGFAAVALVHVSAPAPTTTTTARDVVALVLGVVALVIAGYRVATRRPEPEDPDVVRPVPRWREVASRHARTPPTTTRAAGAAGVLTHLPGVFYLAALAAIVAEDRGVVRSALEVLLYNAFWFAIPLAAVVACATHPDRAYAVAERARAAVRRHRRELGSAVFAVVGVYLVVRGASSLLGQVPQ
jgi:Sap-like sulfolipid-1-addressing protein